MIMGHCGLRGSSSTSRPALLDFDYASDELALAKILVTTRAMGSDPDDRHLWFGTGFETEAR